MKRWLAGIVAGLLLAVSAGAQEVPANKDVGREGGKEGGEGRWVDVAPVWAGHPVGFSLLTHGKHQYAAFYDAERKMKVGHRVVGTKVWDFVGLPSQVGWDSHNYITMAVDDRGCVHLAGNMHASKLTYFRMERPDDIQSFQQVAAMVGREEDRVTYPVFMRDKAGRLIFTYRSGSSGNGDQYFNVYDPEKKAWRRLMDQPLTDGRARSMNAYFSRIVTGPEGKFHISWVWRDSGDCSTNHDLCYARSADLVNWETSEGRPLKLPMTLETAEVVDAAPVKGGLINGNHQVGFDGAGRVLITYHKYDGHGKSQVFVARREEGAGWKSVQVSDCDFRWEFKGGGSIVFEVRVGEARPAGEGKVAVGYSSKAAGSGVWLLDEKTLKVVGKQEARRPTTEPAGDRGEGMITHWADDLGKGEDGKVRYRLWWQTLGANRDQPRAGKLPEAGMLRVWEGD